MSIEKLHPCANDHAIQNAVFVIEWIEPLPSDTMLGLEKLAIKFKNTTTPLPDMQQQQVVAFNFNPAQNAGAQVSHEFGGFIFSRPSESSIAARSVTVARQNCVIVIPDYTRWDQVWADVQSYLKIVLSLVGPKRPLSVIGLQYTDLFNWKDDPADLNLHEIFSDSSYLPPNVFAQQNLWHSHHGYVEQQSDPAPHARLENINVDMLDNAGERSIQVLTSHRATMGGPLWQSHLKNEQLVYDMFASLHSANKTMLRKLFTPAVCEKIQLID